MLVGCFVAANASELLKEEDDPPQWRQGLLGFGLYDKHGIRIDPYDPNEID